ncbi:MAG: hypothetical protein U0636_06020 [Phycisphaerales bacterium]
MVLSSMLVTAVACALESARSNAHARLDRYVGATDVRVVNRFGASFGADQLERVRALPGIAAVAGSWIARAGAARRERWGGRARAPRSARARGLTPMQTRASKWPGDGRRPPAHAYRRDCH